MVSIDEAMTLRAFERVKEQEGIHRDVPPRPILEKGFELEVSGFL